MLTEGHAEEPGTDAVHTSAPGERAVNSGGSKSRVPHTWQERHLDEVWVYTAPRICAECGCSEAKALTDCPMEPLDRDVLNAVRYRRLDYKLPVGWQTAEEFPQLEQARKRAHFRSLLRARQLTLLRGNRTQVQNAELRGLNRLIA